MYNIEFARYSCLSLAEPGSQYPARRQQPNSAVDGSGSSRCGVYHHRYWSWWCHCTKRWRGAESSRLSQSWIGFV